MKPSNLLNQIKIGLQVILPIVVLFLSFGTNGVNPAYAVVDPCLGIGNAFILTLRTSSGGTITALPAPNCTSVGSNSYLVGTTVQLTASPNATFSFIEWRDGTNNASLGTTNPLTFKMNADTKITAIFSIPSNDAFASAKVINSITYTDTLDTIGATQAAATDPDNFGPCTGTGTPSNNMNIGNNSVWYTYTPSVKESIAVDTLGSTYTNPSSLMKGDLDTYVAVWTSVGGVLTLLACNDDRPQGQTSQLSFIGNPATPYYFEIASYNGYEPSPTPGAQLGGSLKFNVNITNTDVAVGSTIKSHYLTSGNIISDTFLSIANGPVKVKDVTGQPIFTSQRAIFGNSFNEVMGYPADKLTTEYWFPYYDMVYMSTWILVGNPSATQTAYVDIYIGTNKTSYSILPGDRVLPTFPGIVDGPVRVVSTTGPGTPSALPIFTSERSSYFSSFNEVMGYPADQFTTEYWFPYYDMVNMSTWILVGNPSTTQTAYVDIYIGTNKTSYTIAPNGRILPTFPGQAVGPVRVVSTTGLGTPSALPIFTSERSSYFSSFNEVMGYPANQFTTDYWFPWYQNNSGGMNTWILVGNPSTSQTAYVDISIGGSVTSYAIPANGSILPTFNVSNGPVHIVSKSGAGTPSALPIFTSERSSYGPSFNEVMGYPGNQLTSEYWFTYYDSINMKTELLVGKP